MPDWAPVRGTSTQPRDRFAERRPPDDWIGNQLCFFIERGESRERWVQILDAISWCLLFASVALAVVLFVWLSIPNAMKLWVADIIRPPSWAMLKGVDLSFLLWALLAALFIEIRALNHDIRQGRGAVFLTIVLGGLAALGFALAFVSAGPLIACATGMHEVDSAVTSTFIAGLVVLSAIAGALRYLMERLNIEAEALEYRDARARFERAERRLARGSDPETGAPADEEAARHVVYELGCLALAENEAWLKSRRERPLTPVVG